MAMGEAVIESQAQLTELDLSDNAFGPTGMKAVVALLTSPACFSLRVLKFNNTGIGIGGGKVGGGSYPCPSLVALTDASLVSDLIACTHGVSGGGGEGWPEAGSRGICCWPEPVGERECNCSVGGVQG